MTRLLMVALLAAGLVACAGHGEPGHFSHPAKHAAAAPGPPAVLTGAVPATQPPRKTYPPPSANPAPAPLPRVASAPPGPPPTPSPEVTRGSSGPSLADWGLILGPLLVWPSCY